MQEQTDWVLVRFFKNGDEKMLRFISDLHLGHYNIIKKLDGRQFETLEEMDEYIIKQWNSVVKPNDETVILGDFSFYNAAKTNEILKRLNGTKYLIKGNHDKNFLKEKDFDRSLIRWVKDYDTFYDKGRKVVCMHYPIIFYDGQYRTDDMGNPSTYMLYGHIHNTQDKELLDKILEFVTQYRYIDKKTGVEKSIPFNMIDCFCMFSDYTPLTLDEWIALSTKTK